LCLPWIRGGENGPRRLTLPCEEIVHAKCGRRFTFGLRSFSQRHNVNLPYKPEVFVFSTAGKPSVKLAHHFTSFKNQSPRSRSFFFAAVPHSASRHSTASRMREITAAMFSVFFFFFSSIKIHQSVSAPKNANTSANIPPCSTILRTQSIATVRRGSWNRSVTTFPVFELPADGAVCTSPFAFDFVFLPFPAPPISFRPKSSTFSTESDRPVEHDPRRPGFILSRLQFLSAVVKHDRIGAQHFMWS